MKCWVPHFSPLLREVGPTTKYSDNVVSEAGRSRFALGTEGTKMTESQEWTQRHAAGGTRAHFLVTLSSSTAYVRFTEERSL